MRASSCLGTWVFGYFVTECCLWGNASKVFNWNPGFEDPSAAPATLCSDFNSLSWRASSLFCTPPIHLKGKVAFPGCLPEVWWVMDFCIREVLARHFPGWPLALGRACSWSFTGYACNSRGGSGVGAKTRARGTAFPDSGFECEFYSSLNLNGVKRSVPVGC